MTDNSNENLRRARAHLTLFLAEEKTRLWPEEIKDLESALSVLNRFKIPGE